MWVVSLLANPYATHLLPDRLLLLDGGRHFDVEFICCEGR